MSTQKTIELLLPKWPEKARKGYTVPNITNNLVSVAELCDADCTVFFHRHGVDINYEGEIIGRGWRDRPSKLWRISLTSEGVDRITPTTDWTTDSDGIFNIQANSIYECENKEQLIKYYHASLCSHPKTVLIAAADAEYLRGCPGLNATAIRKFIGIEYATEMGHMKQIQSGVRATSKKSNRGRPTKSERQQDIDAAAEDAMATPSQVDGNIATHFVFMSTADSKGLVCSDQTGMFPRISNKGMKYVCIFYIYDANYIKSVPIKSREKKELLRAYQEVYAFCQQRGFAPKLHKLDNETSKEVEAFVASQQAEIQYTPPDMHRTNPAERAIQTWKSCKKSSLASVPNDFPLALWCRMCAQVDLSVNIVRKCRQNPLLSAWAAMNGEYHFDAHPIAPPGTLMMMHEKPGRRRTFGFNAKKAWYLGPCFKHYRAVRGLLPSTGGERISDTYRFKHHAIAIPQLTAADRILEAAKQLDAAITQQPTKAPMDEIVAIQLLREILLGESSAPLPSNSVQRRKAAQTAAAKEKSTVEGSVPTIPKGLGTNKECTSKSAPVALEPVQSDEPNKVVVTHKPHLTAIDHDDEPHYISDDESVQHDNHRNRRSKRILRQQRIDNQQALHHIVNLIGYETTHVPDLQVNLNRKVTRGMGHTNEALQMDEWAYHEHFAGAIIDETTGESMEYRDLIKNPKLRAIWEHSLANEIGRLCNGIRDIVGTNTMEFIPKSEIPRDRRKDVTYGRIVVSYRPQKLEKHRSRLTVGGDRINYPFDVSTPTSGLATIKMLWNSVLSTPGAKFFGADLANFYLKTPMKRPEFMRLPYNIILQEIKTAYKLDSLVISLNMHYMVLPRGGIDSAPY